MKSHTRRRFLTAAGVSIALPLLESLPKSNPFGRLQAADQTSSPPTRLVCIGNEFGMYPGAFWPDKDGSDYQLTELLQPWQLIGGTSRCSRIWITTRRVATSPFTPI
ncbi:MAG: hypothetical protein R3C49_20105 [Planctomycetaceae bacterium]